MPTLGKSWSTMQVTNNETRLPMQNQNCSRAANVRERWPTLPPLAQPVRQNRRQARLANSFLRGPHVIRRTAIRDRARAGIVERVCRARVAIARLAHRTGVHQVAAFGIDLHVLPAVTRGCCQDGLHARMVPDEAALHVRVPEKGQPALEADRKT